MDFSPNNVIRVFNALITNISRSRNDTLVTISYNDCPDCTRPVDTIVLAVNRDTIIRDERGRSIGADELETGMTINASFSSAMTRSIPPQAQAFRIRVIRRSNRNRQTTMGRIIEVNRRNEYIVTISSRNPSSIIRFNLSPDTIILDASGRRIRLSMLFPGLQVRVEHANFMTASIPPQTTAFVIQIIR